MLRIRKISDSHTPANRTAIEEAQAIIRAQFPGMPGSEIDKLPDQLGNPFKHRFVAKLLVAEDTRGHVKAVALLLHDPEFAFSYLEIISVAPGGRSGSGIGGAKARTSAVEDAAATRSARLIGTCFTAAAEGLMMWMPGAVGCATFQVDRQLEAWPPLDRR